MATNETILSVDLEYVIVWSEEEQNLDFRVARLSIVTPDSNGTGGVYYDKYFNPEEPIVDLCTDISGIENSHIENADFFSDHMKSIHAMLKKATTIVGFDLEQDMKCLSFFPEEHQVEDVATWFKHLYGATPSLKNVARDMLGINIQLDMHDSVEDAQAALQLYMKFKDSDIRITSMPENKLFQDETLVWKNKIISALEACKTVDTEKLLKLPSFAVFYVSHNASFRFITVRLSCQSISKSTRNSIFKEGCKVHIVFSDPEYTLMGNVIDISKQTFDIAVKFKREKIVEKFSQWMGEGKCRVSYNNHPHKILKSATERIASANRNIQHAIITNKIDNSFCSRFYMSSEIPSLDLNELTENQGEPVANFFNKKCSMTVVVGPPGTGKTKLIQVAVRNIIQFTSENVLVVAPSNKAVAVIARELLKAQLEKHMILMTAKQVKEEILVKILYDLKLKEEIYSLNDSHQYLVMNYIRKQTKNKKEEKIGKLILERVNRKIYREKRVFLCTNIFSQTIESTFDNVIIDEAGKASQPESIVPLLKLNKLSGGVMIVGDPFQLPPTIPAISKERRLLPESILMNELSNSFIQQLISKSNKTYFLNVQFRMNPKIAHVCNSMFYEGAINNGVTEADRPPIWGPVFDNKAPLIALEIDGNERSVNLSYCNDEEVKIVSKIYHELKSMGVTEDDIGIITPYHMQELLLTENLPSATVGTIDSFQGFECNIVICSFVRSTNVGFLEKSNRLNVALSRARCSLILVINPLLWKAHEMCTDLREIVMDKGQIFRLNAANEFEQVTTANLTAHVFKCIVYLPETVNMLSSERLQRLKNIFSAIDSCNFKKMTETHFEVSYSTEAALQKAFKLNWTFPFILQLNLPYPIRVDPFQHLVVPYSSFGISDATVSIDGVATYEHLPELVDRIRQTPGYLNLEPQKRRQNQDGTLMQFYSVLVHFENKAMAYSFVKHYNNGKTYADLRQQKIKRARLFDKSPVSYNPAAI